MFSRDIFEELIPKIKLNKNRRNQNETSEMISPHCELGFFKGLEKRSNDLMD